MKNLLIILLTFVFLIGSATAISNIEDVLTFKQNDNVNINIPCFEDNGDFCNPTIKCNVTAYFPNNTIFINEQQASRGNLLYNYTISNTYTYQLGIYKYVALCNNGSSFGNTLEYFEITPSGNQPTTAMGMMYVTLLLVSVIIFFIVLYVIATTNSANDIDFMGYVKVTYKKYLKFGLIVFNYSILVWIVFLAWKMSEQFLFLDFTLRFFRYLFYLLTMIATPLFLVIMIAYAIHCFIKDNELIKMGNRGLRPR